MQQNLLYKEEYYKIVGLCMEVHKHLNGGLLEIVYKDALEYEFKLAKIPYEKEKLLNINYKDTVLAKHYIADFICYSNIILELKALSDLTSEHESQLINYLKATNLPLGILINLGKPSLEYKRIINKQLLSSTNYPN